MIVQGFLTDAVKKRVFAKVKLPDTVDLDYPLLDRFAYGFFAFKFFQGRRDMINARRFRDILAKVFATCFYFESGEVAGIQSRATRAAARVDAKWSSFISFSLERNPRYGRVFLDPKTGNPRSEIRQDEWLLSREFKIDAEEFFGGKQ